MSAVAYGISKKLSALGKTGLREWFSKWGSQLAAILRRPQPNIVNTATGSVRLQGHAIAVSQSRLKPSSVDEWIEYLRLDIKRLDG